MKLKENITFKELTTFHIGGKIQYLAEVKNKKEVDEAVCFAKKNKLKIFIIGGGSDILIGDSDFQGLVIKYIGDSVDINGDIVTSEAGLIWDKLVEEVVGKNFQGIECLSGIPGSTGAAPIQNIGAYGQELKNVFLKLTAYDIAKEEFVEFESADCEFGYRESVFKKKDYWQKFIITDITLRLNKNGKPEVKYDSLKKYLLEKEIPAPTLRDVRNAVLAVRTTKFENPNEAGNAGSFFKNPVFSDDTAKNLEKKFPGIPLRPLEDGSFKSSAGWLIEQAGWKGKKYKNAAVSARHALILINPEGKATASDVLELSEMIIEDVKKKFDVKLEREVQLINL